MIYKKYSLYQNGVLIYQEDNRLVSVCAQEKLAEIRANCAERIRETGIDWMAVREISGGTAIPQEIKDLCASYRATSNNLENQVKLLQVNALSDEDKQTCDIIENISF
jgi:hypothetical protein